MPSWGGHTNWIYILLTLGLTYSCNIKLNSSKSFISFPVDQQQTYQSKPQIWWGFVPHNKCVLRRRVRPKITMDLTFTNMNLTTNGLEVYVNTMYKQGTWKLLQKIYPSDKSFKISFTNHRAMKIIVDREATFELKYEPVYCTSPESVETKSCTRGKLRDSSCSFSCKRPRFLPVTPEHPQFTATCRNDQKWSTTPESKCKRVLLQNVIEQCIRTNRIQGRCQFNIDELSVFFPEENNKREKSLVEVEKIAAATRANHKNVNWKVEVNLMRRRVPLDHDCYKYCLYSARTRQPLIQCFHEDLSISQSLLCLDCRWDSGICQANKVFE